MLKGAETPIRMLLINDDVSDAEAIVSHLRNSGMAVRPTRPGTLAELNHELEAHVFDLVLLSSPSKQISDNEVLRSVDSHGRDLPLLVEVANVDAATLLALTQAGARTLIPRGQFNHLRAMVQREFEDLQARRGLRTLEARIRETERRCDALIESSRDPIAYVHEGMHIRANSAYLDIFGYESFEDIEPISLLDMVAPADVASFKTLLKQISKGDAPPRHNLQMRDSQGAIFPAVMEFTPAQYEGEPCLQLIIRRQELDLDPALAQEVEELRRLDIATGLLNRQTFLEALEQKVADAATNQREHALLTIELDHFQQISQQVGLNHVDALAAAAAERLRSLIPSSGVMAGRVGENSYALLLEKSTYRETLELAEHIARGFSEKLLDTEKKTLAATVSIGGAQISERNAQVAKVLGKAYEGLQQSAALGGNRVEIFDPRATERMEEEKTAQWVQQVRDAVQHDYLTLHYQSILNVADESEHFHEALLRMRNSDGQLIAAGQFVPMAEEHELAGILDRWEIHRVLQDIRRQMDRGIQQRVLTTISHYSLDDAGLLQDIARHLGQMQIPGNRLVLQLSEPKVFTNLRATQAFVEKLKEMDVGFCISQFGAGLNPMQILEHIQPRFLKINQDLIEDLKESEENRERVVKLVTEAGQLHIACIVHGIQDAATMTTLFSSGVQYMQGSFIAPVTESL